MKKILLYGLLSGLVMLIVGMLVSQLFELLFPSLKAQYENPDLFRPWSDPTMMLYFVHPFLMGIILAWVWSKTKQIFKVESDATAGINFALMFWLCTSPPGMLMSYASFPVTFLMICSWLVSNLLQLLSAGIVISKTLK